jgi:hypothetical protein
MVLARGLSSLELKVIESEKLKVLKSKVGLEDFELMSLSARQPMNNSSSP